MTRLRSRLPLHLWGLIGILSLAIAGYVIFGGRAGLGGESFQLHALFRSDAQLGIRSPVRIAGIQVGEVTAIKPVGHGSDAAVVTMKIDPEGLPIRTDATAKIRSRLLLEGNFAIELKPGSPSAPAMRSGATIPADHTSGPVQLDRVLSDLPIDSRTSLRTVLQGFGGAYGGKPITTAGATEPPADPSTTGETAGKSLNDSLEYLPAALLGATQTSEALLGLDEHDLANAVKAEAALADTFAAHETQLTSLITGFGRTMRAFAVQQGAVGRSLALLPSVLDRTQGALTALDGAFGPTRAFATALTPAMRELPATIAASGPWIDENRRLLSATELGAVAREAQPATRDAAAVTAGTTALLREDDKLNRCLLHNVLPTSETKVADPPLSTGVKVYQEFFQTFVGLTSAAQNFDGNGTYVRGMAGGGSFPVTTSSLPGQGPLRGNATRQPLGTRPAYPGKKAQPPFRPEVACATQTPPDINGAKTGIGP